jgi:hypothetical protein
MRLGTRVNGALKRVRLGASPRSLISVGSAGALGGLVGLVAWYGLRDWRLLAGGLVLLGSWPFIMPVNKRLMALSEADAVPESRALLERWGGLHAVRSGLGAGAVVLMAWGLAAGSVWGMRISLERELG